jgi:hypothetical protein
LTEIGHDLDPDVSGYVEVGLSGYIDTQQGAGAPDSIEIVGQGKIYLRSTLALELLQQVHHRNTSLVTDAEHTDCEISRGFDGIKNGSKVTVHCIILVHRYLLLISVKPVKDLNCEISLGIDSIY